jgi:hypothetical protein
MNVKPQLAIASESQCFFMIFLSILYISVEVLFSFWFFRRVFLEPGSIC